MAGEYSSSAATAGVFSAGSLSATYKEVYAEDMANLIKTNKRFVAYNNISFDQSHRPGGTYHQPALLTFDGYLEFRGPRAGAVSYGAPAPATIQDATILGSNMYGRSLIDNETAARGASSRYVFKNSIGLVAENLMETGADAIERQCWSGGVDDGVISKLATQAADADYVGGTSMGNVPANSFQISAASWMIGAWAGHEGSIITVFSSDLKTARPSATAADSTQSSGIPATGRMTVTAVDTVNRIITVSAIVANVAVGDRVFFATERAWPVTQGTTVGALQTMLGLHAILGATSGTVFGIDVAYSKWAASQVAVGGVITLEAIARMMARLYGKGLSEDSSAVFAPDAWVKLATEWSALKRGDLKTAHGFMLGTNELEVQLLGLKVAIECAPYCRAGQGVHIAWSIAKRIGASDLTDRAPGLDEEYIMKVPGGNTYEFQIYSNQAVYLIPGKCGNYTGITY